MGSLIAGTYFLVKRQVPTIEKSQAGWVILGAVAVYFYSVTLYNEYVKELPLAAVIGIEQAFYILLLALATRIVLKEELSRFIITVIFVTFIGISLVLTSAFLVPESDKLQIEALNYEKDLVSLFGESSNQPFNGKDEQSLNLSGTEERDKNLGNASSVYWNIKEKWSLFTVNELPNKTDSRTTVNGTNMTPYEVNNDGSTQYSWFRVVVEVALLFSCVFCETIENLAISATPLKDVSSMSIAFWQCVLGLISTSITSLIFEDIFIPQSSMDKFYCILQAMFATGVTFLYIIASQLVEPSVLAIVFTLHIPMAILIETFLLQSVTPPTNTWLLISGLIIITLAVFTISIRKFRGVESR